MSSMIGTYVNDAMSATLVVTAANNANGQGAGTFTLGAISLPVNIHYHFQNSVGPVTCLYISGTSDGALDYVGGAGTTENRTYGVIQLAGGLAKPNGVVPFSGPFVRR